MRLYADIQRVDEEQRMVWGYAGTEARATDGMVITRDALSGALDDYMKFANIREMHQQSAVGIAREGTVDDTGLFIGANVVDDQAWEKVKRGVYKGFSIGGKATDRDTIDRSIVTGLTINEISLVDRPADPGAVFDVWRAAGNPENTMKAKPADKAPAKPAIAAAVSAIEEVPVERVAPAAEPDASLAEAVAVAADAPATPEVKAEDPVARATAAAAAANTKASDAIAKVERVLVVVPGDNDIRRGIGMVSQLGYLLSELAYITRDAAFEAEIEGDNSKVPAKLRAALALLAEAFKDMTAEEVAELVAGVDAVVAIENGVIAFSAAGGDIQRAAAAKLSPELSARLVETQKLLIERNWLPALEPASTDEVITRVTGERDKLQTDNDTLLRALTESTENTTKLVERVDGLSSEIERMKAQVVPPKSAATTAAVAVSKEEDVAGVTRAATAELSADEVQRALEAMPKAERDHLITRAALSRPIHITR